MQKNIIDLAQDECRFPVGTDENGVIVFCAEP